MKIESDFLIDTNILIYSIDSKSQYFKYCKDIISENRFIYLANKSVSEFVAVLSKKSLYDVILAEIDNIIANFHILYSNQLSMDIFKGLIKKYKPVGNRVYDFEIVSLMLAYDIKKIVTINEKDFKYIEEIEVLK